MSVLVPFMNMPKTCDDCQVSCDCPHDEHIDGYMMEKPSRFCPLVELPPHGDLIDYNFCLKNYELLHDDDGNPVYAVRMRDINAAPVIIEAEVSE